MQTDEELLSPLDPITKQPKKALLVSVYFNNSLKRECDEHLEELELLCETFGVKVLQKVPCILRKYDSATYVTSGKAEELVELAEKIGADVVIFDDEIPPSQQRNLQNLFKLEVMDRTGVILGVFASRAQTKEAKLQIDLAKTRYLAPRLKKMWSHLSRQHGSGGSGSGGYSKGEGEKQIEIDRRLLKKRIDLLKTEIEEVKNYRDTQRGARVRSEIPTFAIIGYTNAGKSSLMNALTNAGVFVEDKLFATLDTTTRKFTLGSHQGNHQEILLIDTVGFIRKLPHLLVAAFKSTLEEAFQADILIHLIDISNPQADSQLKTTLEVLETLGAKDKPLLTVFNKIDLIDEENQTIIERIKLSQLRQACPRRVEISTKTKQGFEELEALIIDELSKTKKKTILRIPQSDYQAVTEVIRQGNVIKQEYEENDIIIEAYLPHSLEGKLQSYVVNPQE